MEKEFVTYEQALALKELGFDDECLKYYSEEYGMFVVSDYYDGGHFVLAPLKQQVFRWFREKYGWIGGIRQLSQSGNGMIIGEFRKDEDNNFMMFAESYEQCENYCIENLIKIINPQGNG
jgi:hypothetical protein